MKKNNKSSENSKIKSIFSFFKDERFKTVLGSSILIFAVLLVLSFISFLFTWKADQSNLDLVIGDINSVDSQNWIGNAGLRLANFFVNDLFGIASFLIVLMLVIVGLRLVNIRTLSIRKTVRNSILLIIWCSIGLGYVFGRENQMIGGAHGIIVSEWLIRFVGHPGTILVLFISLFTFLMFSIDKFLDKVKDGIKWLIEKVIPKQDGDKENVTDEESADENAVVSEVSFETDDKKEEPTEKVESNELTLETVKTEEEVVDTTPVAEAPEVKEKEVVEPVAEKKVVAGEGDVGLTVNTDAPDEEELAEVKNEPMEDFDPTLELSRFKMPTLDLLVDYKAGDSEVSEEELGRNKDKIVETLGHYSIKIQHIKATIGPTVTLYEIVPAPGIKISRIKNLEDDIALSLAALGIRIIAPMPGKGTIGIEVPNQKPKMVSMRSVVASSKFQDSKFELPIVLGKTISNETYVENLAKMPHLLVAGATGQGKSVGLNAIIASLLYKKHPSQLKFVLVDPKKVELSLYSKIERHYLAKLPDEEEAIITDVSKVIRTLNSLCKEMDERYELLKLAFARNIGEYNAKFIKRKLNPEKGHKYLPYIVLIVDEFADLIITAGKEVEGPIQRLAQLARAIGIHLVIATQRPSANVITGIIKANFPTRIAFKVSSSIDSRTILDSTGANQLIGKGDMLINKDSDLIRLQCAFVDTPEIDELVDYIGSQQGYPTAFHLPEVEDESTGGVDPDVLGSRDEMFEQAARLVTQHQQGSTSLIQRKFSIGYNRAGRIIDQLEAAGIVGPFEGSKARKVLFPDEYSLEQFLNNLNKEGS